MMSLSGAELGPLIEGGYQPCQALQQYDINGSSLRVRLERQRLIPSGGNQELHLTLQTQFSFEKISEYHGSLIAHDLSKTTQCMSK